MGLLSKEVFVCVDCESTGLDPYEDRVIEVAIKRFTFEKELMSYETLVNPGREIPQASIAIHHITQEMVKDAPKIHEVMPQVLEMLSGAIIVGHGISFDIDILIESAKRAGLSSAFLKKADSLDTLRLARLYGQSPSNSLQSLRSHFNIEDEGAHRAMGDVIVNIEVFKKLTMNFKTTRQVVEALKRPIEMKTMPLGKYKGRLFGEIPVNYLTWVSHQDFDQDLLYSIRKELKRRRQKQNFSQSHNPFSQLE